MTDPSSFQTADVPQIGRRVLRLGVAANNGLVADDIHHAAERGVNCWLWGRSFKRATPALRELLARDREAHVVVVLGMTVYTARGARRTIDGARKQLGIEQLDAFLLPWLGRASRFSPAIQDQLVAQREAGAVRALGTSIHDRQRAGALARDSILDGLMIRYSAKHPGAEEDIFPHLAARDPFVLSYTATAWRQLIRPLRGIEMPPWPGGGEPPPPPPMTAGHCYRFVLGSPHVHVTWTAPANRAELDANLDALEAGPLSAEELAWVREYGRQVKAKRRMDYR